MSRRPEYHEPEEWQAMEERYFGLADAESVDSNDSAAVNQRLTESYTGPDEPVMPQASDEAAVQTEVSFSDESPLQIMIQTQDPPGILAQVIAPRASASHAEVIAPRVSAASRMSEPYGTDAIGSYRQMTGMGVSLFKTIRGERVHVGSCRHLRDDNGFMWSSNQRLIRCDCIEKLYAGKPYQLTSLRNGFMKLHASNTCGLWQANERLVRSLKACEICTRR